MNKGDRLINLESLDFKEFGQVLLVIDLTLPHIIGGEIL